MDMKAFNMQIIEEFRANKGKVSMFADYPMVILLVPLVLTINEADEWLLFGSYAGAQKNPSWVYNLRAHPEIDIEYAEETFKARVVELPEDEANAKVALQATISDQFAEYVTSAAPRRIPVFRIDRPESV